MRRSLLLALVLAGCASPAPSPDPPAPEAPAAPEVRATAERELALRLLLEARTLQSAQVGYGGDLPDEVIAYRRLLLEPDAPALFEGLIGSARPAGRLYALCGLREVDPARAAALARPLLADETPVSTLDGCLGGSQAAQALARQLLDDENVAMVRWRADVRGDRSTWNEGAATPTDAEVAAALAGLDERAELARRADPPSEAFALDDEAEAERLRRAAVDQGAFQAASTLAAFGPAVVPGLVERLAREDALDRALAVLALNDLGRWAGEAGLAAVAAAANDESLLVREWALVALRERRDAAARAALVLALRRERQPGLLEESLQALRWHEPGPDLTDALAPLLTRRDEVPRRLAAELLVRAGPGAAVALAPLTELARTEDDAGNHALAALAGLEPALAGATLAALLLELDDQPSRQWFVAARMIELPPEGARRAVAVLLERSAPEQAGALRSAKGSGARVDVLVKTLALPARAAVLAAFVGLAHERAALEALEPLARSTRDEDPLLRHLAVRALCRHGARALPALARMDDEEVLRHQLWRLLVEGDPAERTGALTWAGSAAAGSAREVVARGVQEWLDEAHGPRGLDEWRAAIALLRRWERHEALAHIARTAEDPEVRALARGPR